MQKRGRPRKGARAVLFVRVPLEVKQSVAQIAAALGTDTNGFVEKLLAKECKRARNRS